MGSEKAPKRKLKRSDLSLEQYVRNLHAAVDSFAENWKAGHKNKPEDWPMSMKDGALESAEMQWADQFRAWMGWDE